MKHRDPADIAAGQRRDRAALDLAEREGIPFAEAWLRVLHEESLEGRGK